MFINIPKLTLYIFARLLSIRQEFFLIYIILLNYSFILCRLFLSPLYCSILSEQHLLMNRRRQIKRIRKDFVNGAEVFR